ncbi:taste receptor type 1 member 1 [Genypterus blacodes]|uniref:taste receptor type 1 member 1 n=1 Tax=Genypterus blacodes TaxID=154954 RepID=UPI003F76DA65
MCAALLLAVGCISMQRAGAELDYLSQGRGMQLQGDFSIAGFFPLHYADGAEPGRPALGPCNQGKINRHGFHLMQAMRFAVEEINNGSGGSPVLPGVTLGYQMYDICSKPASILATLDLLEQQQHQRGGGASEAAHRAVAVIGPDSSSKSFTPAALLGTHYIPQIAYEASNEMLSNKFLYPSFFRTIPSDKNQVTAMLQLLVRFGWTWVALLGSDNAYGLQGMQSLSQQAPHYGICIAYQGVIPARTDETVQRMRNMVENILTTKVNTIVVFSSKSKLSGFFPFVVEKNVTGKVWIGTEDWSVASLISGIRGVHTIGTVLGVSVKQASLSGLEEFESKDADAAEQEVSNKRSGNACLQSADLYTMAGQSTALESYDIISSFNVYKAVYAVAHALHKALECDSGECHKGAIQPWQVLPWLKQVRFSVRNTSVYFDQNGDPPTGYDIVAWVWRGTDWSLRCVGSFSPDPISLTIDATQIEWHSNGTPPPSVCSPACAVGHRQLMKGHHTCCFDCLPCPAATFLNRSALTTCQPCLREQWSPPTSEQCLDRAVLLLAWDDPLTVALLVFLATCVLMTSGSALVLLINLNTPVAKSAGGRTCLLMLAALTVAALSSLCHFGEPSPLSCILKQPLFNFSFTVCLACITVRSFQVVCIFKFASKLPAFYDKWTKNHGPEFTILLVSIFILLLSIFRVGLNPPQPSKDLDFYHDSIVLECSNTLSPGAMLELGYVSMLSALCFAFSYMGKDLPANYNEAKCVTFSLMVYMISWMSFFTIYFISRGSFTMAAQVFATLFSVLAFLGGYFLPKIYIIVLKPQMNTTGHFQNCIQMYTMNK